MAAERAPVGGFIRTMRPHHWAKNLLVFVPLLTAHEYENLTLVLQACVAFACFSLCASGGYFLNDLKDLEADRQHDTKRNRPLASGALAPSLGVVGAIGLPLAALALAWFYLPRPFLIVLASYFVLNLSYSFALKRIFTADVLALSVLYMLRVLGGAVAIGVDLSSWLLAFCIFLFISLAYLKRYIELRKTDNGSDKVRGRGYVGVDTDSMFILGVANATASVVVLALFINSPEVELEYSSRDVLWGLCLVMIFWTNRVWIAARRGDVLEDPVEYALRDRASQIAGLICVVLVLVARYFVLPL
ncbi:UbiA family prenyltransferase [Rhodomicrobium vannielii]|uniref:UbiA family prenyltransferase n=1 Tax=Rhodomicrobium vannielii TaxID=1069 RepID=UPI001AECC62D|nr:UbiA family prenyltransferase [Rhodomicrobium vannielii]